MRRALLGLLSAGLLLTASSGAHGDPSGIRYDARTRTYTNAGSRPAAATAPATTTRSRATRDPDFVEYTLSPSKTTTAPTAPAAASVPAPVTPPVAAPVSTGLTAYPTLGTPYSLGYGATYGGGFYAGSYYGAAGYLPYGCGAYTGYGQPYFGTTSFYNGSGNLSRQPTVTTTWIPFVGNVQNVNIPGFGLGGYGYGYGPGWGYGGQAWGGGIAPCTYGAATVRVRARVR